MNSNNLSIDPISQNFSINPNLPIFNYSSSQYGEEQAKVLQNFRIALEIKQIKVRYLELEKIEKSHQNSIRLNDLLLKHLEAGEYEKALQIKKILNYDDQNPIRNDEAESGYESENMHSDLSENIQLTNPVPSDQVVEHPTETMDSEIEVINQNNQIFSENSQMTEIENVVYPQPNVTIISGSDYFPTSKRPLNYDQTTYFVTSSTDKSYHSKMNILYKTEKFECTSCQKDKYECDIKELHYHLIVKFGCKYHLSYLYKRLNLPFFKVSIVNNPKLLEFLIKKYNMVKY